MATLPVDIISDILCRLPVKTLLRFRSVSKEFRSLIDHPGFINRHLQYLQYQTLKYPKLIFECLVKDSTLALLDLNSVDNYVRVAVPFENIEGNSVDLGENRFDSDLEIEVIGSCNGLLAVCRFGPGVLQIILWNMSTKKHRTLPKCDFIEDSYINNAYFYWGGFGYDAATDDYKLILIHEFNQVVVYSLKANCWRRIENCPHIFNLYEWGVLVKDTLNWQGRGVPEDYKHHHLFGFNLKDELFYELPLPDETDKYLSRRAFMDLGGCLSFLYFSNVDPPLVSVVEMWMMKEYGLKDSWVKLYSISIKETPFRSLRDPVCCLTNVYSEHGDEIFIFNRGGPVLRYDFKEQQSVLFQINEFPLQYLNYIKKYVESLVSP